MVQLSDSSFVGVGAVYFNANSGHKSLYLLKVDARGNKLISKALTSFSTSEGYALVAANDGSIMVSGSSDNGAIVMKCNADLSVQWIKQYAGNELSARKIIAVDGGYLLTFISDVYRKNASYLVKIDYDGNVIFSKQVSDVGRKKITDITETKDGNYVFIATAADNGISDSAFVTKVKADGTFLWSRNLIDPVFGVTASAITATPDGGIVVAGEISNFDAAEVYQFLMFKYDDSGNLLWSKTMDLPSYSNSYGFAVTLDRDNGYLFSGNREAYTDEEYEDLDSNYIYLVKTNASGDVQWTKNLEPSATDYANVYGLIQTLDGGYATVGELDVENDYDYQAGSFIYKYDENFQSCGTLPRSSGTPKNIGTSLPGSEPVTDVTFNVSEFTASFGETGSVNVVCSGVLPVQFLSFTAAPNNQGVAIQWKTANEINTAHFVVERSSDGVSFTSLQTVAAKGNNMGVETYVTSDFQPLPGTSYYRLKEVDTDGRTTYSSIVPVTVLKRNAAVIHPNPVQNSVNITLQSDVNTKITMRIFDTKGKVLLTRETSLTAGTNSIQIPAASLAKGVYILQLIQDNTSQTLRFIKN